MGEADRVLVIGAGIVGISAALALQARGRAVTVLDRAGVAAGASAGNAGAFAFADILPLASPGIIARAPRWLLDPLGPLSIPPRHALAILPWLMRFWRASWRDRVEASTRAQAALMTHCAAALDRQLADTGAGHLIRAEGQLALYEPAARAAGEADWAMRAAHGVVAERLDGAAAIAEVQPGLAQRFTLGFFTPGWRNATDPLAFAEWLAQVFRDRGGRIERTEVRGLSANADAATAHLADGAARRAGHLVLAAGAFSHLLAKSLGERLPLETERGYNVTLPPGEVELRTHLTFPSHGFVMTRIGSRIRVGGAVELGGLKLPPNHARGDAMLGKARSFLPGLPGTGGARWMGFRPSLPDSLPAIGRSAASPRVIHACGHGHLGLTQAAGTAELVADLVCGGTPALDLAPFRPDRFARFP